MVRAQAPRLLLPRGDQPPFAALYASAPAAFLPALRIAGLLARQRYVEGAWHGKTGSAFASHRSRVLFRRTREDLPSQGPKARTRGVSRRLHRERLLRRIESRHRARAQ